MIATPPPSKPSPLQKIISGDLGPLSQIQDSLGLSLEDFADWMADPDNRRRINDLISAQNAATESLLAQHRAAVAATLIQLALGDSAPPETRRRACIDILKLRIFDPHKDDRLRPRPPKPPPPRPMMHPDDVRAVMEALYYKNDPQSAACGLAHSRDSSNLPILHPVAVQPPHPTKPGQSETTPLPSLHNKPGQSENVRQHFLAPPRVERPHATINSTSPINCPPHAGSDDHRSHRDRCEEDPDRPRTPATLSPTAQSVQLVSYETSCSTPVSTPASPDSSMRRVSYETIHKPARAGSPSTWQPLFNGHKPTSRPHEVLRTLCPELRMRFQPARNDPSRNDSSHNWPNSLNSHWSRPP